jgi:TPR repeat protein
VHDYWIPCFLFFLKIANKRKKDMNAAEEMYSKACDGRISKSCLGMAVILMNKGEKKRAFGFFERACELGDPYGCSNAHVMCREGDGVEKDLQKAEQLKQTGKSLAAQLGLNVE